MMIKVARTVGLVAMLALVLIHVVAFVAYAFVHNHAARSAAEDIARYGDVLEAKGCDVRLSERIVIHSNTKHVKPHPWVYSFGRSQTLQFGISQDGSHGVRYLVFGAWRYDQSTRRDRWRIDLEIDTRR